MIIMNVLINIEFLESREGEELALYVSYQQT